MDQYINGAGGYVANPDATSGCEFCAVYVPLVCAPWNIWTMLTCFLSAHRATTDDFLATISTGANLIWRNWAIVVAFCFINILGALGLYWLARVPKGARKSKKDKKE